MRPLFLLALFLVACSKPQPPADGGIPTIGPAPEAIGLKGKSFYTKTYDSAAIAKADSIIAVFQSRETATEDDFIEIGRQFVATGRYQDAIENYTHGLRNFPYSFKLLRHRGHRYITVRELDKAYDDLNNAAKLIASHKDVPELDASGKPTSTYQHQIWYHLGVYYFLKGNFNKAAENFEKAVAAAKEPANIVGASDWLYNSWMRAGRNEKAEASIKNISPDVDMDHKHAYYTRVMLYKGVMKPTEVVRENIPADSLTVMDMTKLYGVANWYRYKGDTSHANMLCREILKSKNWEGFAYACAERDVNKE